MGLPPPFDSDLAQKLARLEGEIIGAAELLRTGIAIVASLLTIILGFVAMLYKSIREDIAVLRNRDRTLASVVNRIVGKKPTEAVTFEE